MQMSMSISPAMEPYPQPPPGVDSPLLTSPVHPYTLAALEQQHAVYYPPAEYGAPGEMEMYCGPPPAGYEQSPISLYGDAGAYHGQPPSYHPNDNMPSFAQAYLAS
ncbi:hypothetical protein GLOTRDRAFT_111785 [Gloeophyllum trabeum ATCC 11539]|uniref:Uncharacterized protein n=1 Tax=Gloeophyllum trabeum (strain ATCC 11539 / FP-39264 / Madison 617) TaxID=670483 RepID=S7Q1H1_GLOTA|nr:uncharacterized protein GLOTRDRAFT_111785 [Gloeophyllum trabeum ATCC 11539]EPQ53816.1 hypothetical protein GLOTRDRAFT_111785 [Gloeophyllum trabeum ATCC 11539]